MAEVPYKQIRHALTIENGLICNGDLVIPYKTQTKRVIRSVHDDNVD